MNHNFDLWVSEPELKWCESLLQGQPRLTDSRAREILQQQTNMSDIRIIKAVNMLRRYGRI